MEDKLRLNTQFFGGFQGIIGRREFFLNIFVFLYSINQLVSLPFSLWIYTHIQTFEDFFHLNKMFISAPILLKIWVILVSLGSCVIFLSNMVRRLNDINGKVNNFVNIICSLLFIMSALCFLMPTGTVSLVWFIGFVVGLILIFQKGKITSQYPKDFRKDFNIGAFLGTWVWGLFNKSYKPLWILLLMLTPWVFPFAVYCGMKGNEWAYNNKTWENEQKFKKSQENQTIFWVIFQFVVVPVIYTIIVFGVIGALIFSTISSDSKTVTKNIENTESKLSKVMKNISTLYFTKYEITENENKFYVDPFDWKYSTFKDKKDMLDFAASIASNERETMEKKINPNSTKYFSKTSELKRTKIYNSENEKLLGEYVLNEENLDSISIKNILKEAIKAYRFYNL